MRGSPPPAALIAAFRARLLSDARLVLFGHSASLALVVILIWDDQPLAAIAWWGGLVVVTTVLRALWQMAVGRGHLSDAVVLSGARALALVHGLVWGAGVGTLVAMGLSLAHTALVLIVFSGLLASATNTLMADRVSMYALAGAMLAPVFVGLVVAGTDRDHLVAAVMVVVFGVVLVSLHERGHRALREQLRTTALLASSEARFRRVAESNIVGICFWDLDGYVRDANDEALRVFGYTRDDLDAGRVSWRAMPPPEYAQQVAAALELFGQGNTVPPWEMEIIRKDGSRVAAFVGLAPVPESRTQGLAFVLDVTERKRAEQAMRDARDLAERVAQARSMFLANMSHEIRTPMNAVLGMTEIVLDSNLTNEQRHFLEVAHSAAESLLGVINDILDYSKIEADRLDVETIPFDLPRLVHATASMLAMRARDKSLELIPDIAGDVATTVRGDPSRLRQVLTNLIGNAIKFTERGEVVVSVRHQALDDGRAGVEFAVRDTGIGIAADRLDKIFEAFTQADGATSRRYGGTGLGLTIAQRLVGLMGGAISVTSEVGRGTEFRFTLPLAADSAQAAARPPAPVPIGGRRMLIVDDNATNRRILREMLDAEGALIDEAKDAETALAILRSTHAGGSRPAIVLIDGRMPGRDGFDVAAEIRRDPSLAGLAILMLTSSGRRGDGARCREIGVNGYLTKPLSRSDLLEAIAAILSGQSLEGSDRVITRHALSEIRQSLRVLLAEDNVVNQEVGAAMLRKRGHRVDIVANGRAALAAVKREGYDVVLMDVQMPEMDGFEATAAIRALGERGTLPIVAVTANALSGERERCMEHGMDAYLAKPFKAHELFATVEGWGREVAPPPAQPPTPAAAAAVNIATLRDELREAGAEGALDGILDAFLASANERVTALRDALTSGTPATVARAAHALRSSAGTIGALPLATLLAEIETAGRAERLTDRAALAERVRDLAAAVQAELVAYRKQAA